MVQNRSLEAAWAALGAYRGVLVASCDFLGAFWGVLRRLGGVLERLGGLSDQKKTIFSMETTKIC